MHYEVLCLNQLLQLYIPDLVSDDIVIYHLFNSRKVLPSSILREKFIEFVLMGFDPHNPNLSPTSRIMMKSIVACIDK